MKKVEVFCTFQLPGIHAWPECPYEEVSYLRDPHRHVFHFKCHIEVNHDNRDVEFIILKRQIQCYLESKYTSKFSSNMCEFGSMSCEMIAQELVDVFDLSRCEVSEDGENGAIVTRVENE